MKSIVLIPILSFLITFMLIPVFRIIAIKIGLVDNPNYRKVHCVPIPLVGGISIFIATTLSIGISVDFEQLIEYKNFFLYTTILVIMGVIDDRFDLKASLKLLIQLILSHLIYNQGVSIESFYGIFSIYGLDETMQYFITMILIVGTINAFNLMDGIDGLAAGISIIGFSLFMLISLQLGQKILALLLATLLGSTLAFLKFNLSKTNKIFMGDAGSLMIGFILVVSGIKLLKNSQYSQNSSWIVLSVVGIFLVPVLDALRVFSKRIKVGKSPFYADRTHLHHLVLSTGLNHYKSALFIISVVISIIAMGIYFYSLLGLTFAISIIIFLFYLIIKVLVFQKSLNYWKIFIHKKEVAYRK